MLLFLILTLKLFVVAAPSLQAKNSNTKVLNIKKKHKPYNKNSSLSKNVKAIYVHMQATKQNRRERLINIIKSTPINSFVIDIKHERGRLLYRSNTFKRYYPKITRPGFLHDNLATLVNDLKQQRVYLIARIVVFKDELFSKYYPQLVLKNAKGHDFIDRDGLKWIDPQHKSYWQYILQLCQEAFVAGFDEVQLDYVRYPATKQPLMVAEHKNDMPMGDTIQNFIKYITKKLGPKKSQQLSIDIFGMVGNLPKDLAIGQNWERLAKSVSILSPMMYPSHYPLGFKKIKTPDTQPYLTIKKSLISMIKRNQKIKNPARIRPWIQGFTAKWLPKYLNYRKDELKQQILALAEYGITEYMIWHPYSKYEHLFQNVYSFSSPPFD